MALDEQIEIMSGDEANNMVPVAESIVRAQKQFMIMELECIRKFSFDAFMEFSDLRSDLLEMQMISQIQCRALDTARMQRLVKIRDHPSTLQQGKPEEGKTYFIEERPFKYEEVKWTKDLEVDADKPLYQVPPQNMSK